MLLSMTVCRDPIPPLPALSYAITGEGDQLAENILAGDIRGRRLPELPRGGCDASSRGKVALGPEVAEAGSPTRPGRTRSSRSPDEWLPRLTREPVPVVLNRQRNVFPGPLRSRAPSPRSCGRAVSQ